MKATPKTAAVAGIWAAFGLVPFEAWMDRQTTLSTTSHNLLWAAMFAMFLAIPGYFLVLGSESEPFDRDWFLNLQERARYGIVAKRMLVWFLAGGVTMMVWSTIVWLQFRVR
jgi:hypothetical protein